MIGQYRPEKRWVSARELSAALEGLNGDVKRCAELLATGVDDLDDAWNIFDRVTETHSPLAPPDDGFRVPHAGWCALRAALGPEATARMDRARKVTV